MGVISMLFLPVSLRMLRLEYRGGTDMRNNIQFTVYTVHKISQNIQCNIHLLVDTLIISSAVSARKQKYGHLGSIMINTQ